jgi:hypothetical protein
LVAGFGVAAVLSEEAYQADSAVCGFGSGEGGPGGPSDTVEDFGFASVVERFCVCVAKDSRVGAGCRNWVEAFWEGVPHGCRRGKSISQGLASLDGRED